MSNLWAMDLTTAAKSVGEWALSTARWKRQCALKAECVVIEVTRDDIIRNPRAVLDAVEGALKLSSHGGKPRAQPFSRSVLADAVPAQDDLDLIKDIFTQYMRRARQESLEPYLPPLFYFQ